MAVTILDIAKASGKSYPTVSRALNDHPKISDKTKREIRAVAERLGYRPSFVGTALKKGRTGTLSVIVPDLADPFYAEFIRCFKVAASGGFDVVVYDYERKPELERKYLERMLTGCCDGTLAFITSFQYTSDLVAKLWHARIPLVTVGTPHEFADGAKYDWLSVNTSVAISQILEHLKGEGKRHLVRLLGPAPEPIFRLYSENLGQLLKAAGLPLAEHALFTVDGVSLDQAEGGLLAGREIIRRYPETDMIWALNGFQAYGLLLAARECGRRIPEDLAVIVNDNTWINRYSTAPLYGIDQQLSQLAAKAFEFLQQRLESASWPEPQRFEYPGRAVFPPINS